MFCSADFNKSTIDNPLTQDKIYKNKTKLSFIKKITLEFLFNKKITLELQIIQPSNYCSNKTKKQKNEQLNQ